MSASAFLSAVQDRVSPTALAELGAAIERTEILLKEQMLSGVQTVADCGNQTLLAGGKRLRPALAAASAFACGSQEPEGLVGVAAALEMIHMATLIHDDVIDGALTRRGVPTASAVYGSTEAILSGDVLLAKAMRLLAEHSDMEMIRAVSQAVVELAEGEVFELECRGRLDLSEHDHLRILDLKTATFIACCCRAGAKLQGAPAETERALGNYGHHLGIAFQLVDDWLDYAGTHQKTGKPRATDFRDGQATWPLIALLPLLEESDRSRIEAAFGKHCTEGEIDWLVELMQENDTLEATRRKAQDHVDAALRALADLPDGEFSAVLETVARFVIEREA